MLERTLHRKKATAEDYMNLPEGASYQLINGELVMSAAPKKNHQDILRELVLEMGNFLRERPIGVIYSAPFDVHFDEENIFQPNICFISNENMKNFRENGYFYGAPDLVIEILSASTAIEDFTRKFRVYEKYGVMEYFIVDPELKEVIGYSLSEGKYQESYRESGIIVSKVLNHEFHF